MAAIKNEGDGSTPEGQFPLRRVFYRPDRVVKPKTALPVIALQPNMGWCDAPDHRSYNTLITRPFSASHERLWRDDSLYDVIVELGYNDDPVIADNGSAIFLHVAHEAYRPTAGCVAVALADLMRLLRQCDERTQMKIGKHH